MPRRDDDVRQGDRRPARRAVVTGLLRSAVLLVATCTAPFAAAQVTSLDGEWLIATDPANVGRGQEWFRKDAVPDARHCVVPDVLERTFPGYDGVVWYWKSFTEKSAGPHERILVRFRAADYLADVWMNGTHAGSHEGGETPFRLDITRLVRAGSNRLVVRVLNPGKDPVDGYTLAETPHGIKSVPMTVGRFWNPGGLWQSVELLRVPALRIGDMFLDAKPSGGTVTAELSVINDSGSPRPIKLRLSVQPAAGGETQAEHTETVQVPPGSTKLTRTIQVASRRLWSPDDPYLYRFTAELDGGGLHHSESVRFGFREFVFRDGYFRLNGKRIYIRSSHSVGHFPIGQHVPDDPELLRRELIYAKTMGFNMVRWLGRTMFPSQLNLCDELGLMVYQESYASWLWNDSPKMKERFNSAVREMVLRDRNHPAVVAWGLLNETRDGVLFRHAVNMLPVVREVDPTRMVFLNSGRWDGDYSIGSLANPRSPQWMHALGEEAADARSRAGGKFVGGYLEGAGDLHMYVARPWSPESLEFFRTVGSASRNVFLSEYGNGSQIDPLRLTRLFEQRGARPDLEDAALYRGMLERLQADWKRWGLNDVFPTISDIVREGERIHSTQRLIALNAIRSNPKLAGYSLTGLSDQAVEGEGLMTTFRELKPGVVDAIRDGFAPLRWCLFAEPVHLYSGDSLTLQAVLANEDILKPGEYPVRIRMTGPAGVAFEKTAMVKIPAPDSSPEPPMAIPVFHERVVVRGPAGTYDVAAFFDSGAAAVGRQSVIVGDRATQPRLKGQVAVWDDQPALSELLREAGADVRPYEPGDAASSAPVIFVGGTKGPLGSPGDYRALLDKVRRGSTAVFLSPAALGAKKEPLALLDLPGKGKLADASGYFWGRDDIVKPHRIFEGLPDRGLMDLAYYRDIVPSRSFTEFGDAEVIVPSFALGRPGGQGYWSGANLVVHRLGKGRVVLSTLRLLENIRKHPAADRILLNLASYAGQ